MKLRNSLAAILIAASSGVAAPPAAVVEGENFRIEFDPAMHSRVVAKFEGKQTTIGDFAPSEFVTVDGKQIKEFALGDQSLGSTGGHRWQKISGVAPSLMKTIEVDTLFSPRMALFSVDYTNTGTHDIRISSWTNNAYSVSGKVFWSYQSGSYEKRPDWVVPLKPGFRQENFMGMNASDYGGGTPVSDVWRRDVGIAVGHLEAAPKLVSLPVAMPDTDHAMVGVTYKRDVLLKPGETLKTFRTFVIVHRGDYFQALQDYSQAMQQQNGVNFHPAPESAFQPIWCAWGFERHFKVSQILNALPTVKKVGFDWVGVDYGWETADGDWALTPEKFPRGDADMKALVDKIHAEGFRAQLWWLPLGTRPEAKIAREHPEWLLQNADGSREKISFFNDYYFCPAVPEVMEHYRKLVVKIVRDWGYDGLKLDGMHMNGAPPCYNPAHRHARPEESVEAMPQFFKMIYDTARSIKPDVLVEWCPCGTAANFFTLPYINMSVASDPESSFQVRSKAKTLKALHGDALAYFGDHVELSTGHDDFASTVGVGGVVGSEFTWPPGARGHNRDDLTPAKEALWTKWVALYKDKMLSRGEYLGGLYDVGFDLPEAHAIRKSNAMYYAFYAPDWKGKVELRGLSNRTYRVSDYENGKDLGTVRGPVAPLEVSFRKHLLLEAYPASE